MAREAGSVRVVIDLNPDEAERLSRLIRGQGGFQSLLRRLQAQLTDDSQMVLGLADVRRIVRYQARYGTGGFQGRLEAVISALSRLAQALRFP